MPLFLRYAVGFSLQGNEELRGFTATRFCRFWELIFVTIISPLRGWFIVEMKFSAPRFHRYAVLQVLGAHFVTIISPLRGWFFVARKRGTPRFHRYAVLLILWVRTCYHCFTATRLVFRFKQIRALRFHPYLIRKVKLCGLMFRLITFATNVSPLPYQEGKARRLVFRFKQIRASRFHPYLISKVKLRGWFTVQI